MKHSGFAQNTRFQDITDIITKNGYLKYPNDMDEFIVVDEELNMIAYWATHHWCQFPTYTVVAALLLDITWHLSKSCKPSVNFMDIVSTKLELLPEKWELTDLMVYTKEYPDGSDYQHAVLLSAALGVDAACRKLFEKHRDGRPINETLDV